MFTGLENASCDRDQAAQIALSPKYNSGRRSQQRGREPRPRTKTAGTVATVKKRAPLVSS